MFLCMRTTVDLPDHLLWQAKNIAMQRRISLKQLIIEGLETVFRDSTKDEARKASALLRLQQGIHLGGTPSLRDSLHER
jgi:predicted DNA-binding ribbon-helix-helix protein